MVEGVLAYFPKVGLCDLLAGCVYEPPAPVLTSEYLNPLWNLVCTYIMTSEPISVAYFINTFYQSVYLPIVAGKVSIKYIPRLSENVPTATNTRNNRRFVGRVSVGLCIPLSLLGNKSGKTFPRQRRIVGGVSFSAVCVRLKQRILVVSRTSGFLYRFIAQEAPLWRLVEI
jgi:hypothetical protein